jgi:hypothetical protein
MSIFDEPLVMADSTVNGLSLVGSMLGECASRRHIRLKHPSLARVAVLSARDAWVVPCESSPISMHNTGKAHVRRDSPECGLGFKKVFANNMTQGENEQDV